MHKTKLNNGFTLIFKKTKTDSVTIEIAVKTGSNNERDGIRGISHFIEHMLFEGTKHRTSMQTANDIESLGGEFNAATSNEVTFYYVKILKKHFKKALDVLSDIIQNPLFNKKSIEKERQIILSEAKMVNDDPRFYQWLLFERSLYKKHPAKHPVVGYIDDIKNISKKDILDYYKEHYIPDNIVITVVGNIGQSSLNDIKNKFHLKSSKPINIKYVDEPVKTKPSFISEKKDVKQSYVILGYNTVERKHKDSYILDVIKAILGRGLSGRLFNEIRGKRGLGYEVGIHHDINPTYGFFAAYVTVDKKNIQLVKKIILNEFKKLKNLTAKELKEAKDYIEGEFLLRNEDTQDYANAVSFWELSSEAEDINKYLKNINDVTKSDIVKTVKKYLNKNYTMTVIKQNQ